MTDRLDKHVVTLGLCPSRSQAQQWIKAGNILVNGQAVLETSFKASEADVITLKEPIRYVSRGGLKLEGALRDFSIDPTAQICLDIGASTGGFTDCLLQHGAIFVYAIDVGSEQLAERLKTHPQVASFEQTHVADLGKIGINKVVSFTVIDTSFISILKVLPPVLDFLEKQLTEEGMHLRPSVIALIKPQFEYGEIFPEKSFKGVVSNAKERQVLLASVHQEIQAAFPRWSIVATTDSPIKGPSGNLEQFVYLQLS